MLSLKNDERWIGSKGNVRIDKKKVCAVTLVRKRFSEPDMMKVIILVISGS